MNGFKRILVPVDFSGGSHAALETASYLATALGATVDILHVWDGAGENLLPAMTLFVQNAGRVDALKAETAAHGLAMQEAASFLSDIVHRGFALRAMFERGPVADTIVKKAAEGGYDLVLMGTHGRTGLGRVILGSIAEAVVRQCPVPVLTVRQSAEEITAAARG